MNWYSVAKTYIEYETGKKKEMGEKDTFERHPARTRLRQLAFLVFDNTVWLLTDADKKRKAGIRKVHEKPLASTDRRKVSSNVELGEFRQIAGQVRVAVKNSSNGNSIIGVVSISTKHRFYGLKFRS